MQLCQQPVGNLAIASKVLTFNLDVDRSRQTEVQNLGHDVRRQKVEDRTRKCSGQALAQRGDVIRRWMMVFLQRDQDVGIARAPDSEVAC
jgi:hypothetical protein